MKSEEDLVKYRICVHCFCFLYFWITGLFLTLTIFPSQCHNLLPNILNRLNNVPLPFRLRAGHLASHSSNVATPTPTMTPKSNDSPPVVKLRRRCYEPKHRRTCFSKQQLIKTNQAIVKFKNICTVHLKDWTFSNQWSSFPYVLNRSLRSRFCGGPIVCL